jgi:uncharacterized DUF497 family protein
MIRIGGLVWDESAEDHIAKHGVTADEVDDAIHHIMYARRSRKPLMVIARTDAGRVITVVLTPERGSMWYPVTARDSSASERRLVRRRLGAKGK